MNCVAGNTEGTDSNIAHLPFSGMQELADDDVPSVSF